MKELVRCLKKLGAKNRSRLIVMGRFCGGGEEDRSNRDTRKIMSIFYITDPMGLAQERD